MHPALRRSGLRKNEQNAQETFSFVINEKRVRLLLHNLTQNTAFPLSVVQILFALLFSPSISLRIKLCNSCTNTHLKCIVKLHDIGVVNGPKYTSLRSGMFHLFPSYNVGL